MCEGKIKQSVNQEQRLSPSWVILVQIDYKTRVLFRNIIIIINYFINVFII